MNVYSYKDIWRVSLPIMLGLLTQNIMQISNTIFLSRVGEIEFAAAGLAGIYYIAFFMLGFGFSIGAQIIIGRRNGAERYHDIGSIVLQGMMFLFVFAILIYFIANLFSEKVLPSLMKSDAVYHAAVDYLHWRTFGFFFASVNIMFRAFYVGIARTKVLTLNALVMTIVNILFDYLLIFGNFGFPELGISGAGIASVIAEISSILFFIIYTYATVDLSKYGFHKMKFKITVVYDILKVSVFTMLQYAISMSTWFIFFLAIENHGERDLAITNILRTFYMIYFVPMNALATTANTLVSNTMGMKNYAGVIPLVKKIAILNFSIIIVMSIITIIGIRFWISLIVSSADMSLIDQTVIPLLVLISALPICSIGTILFNSISGTGNTQSALLLEFISVLGYVTYLWYVVIYSKASVALCWTTEHFYWGGILILSILYLKKARWRNKTI